MNKTKCLQPCYCSSFVAMSSALQPYMLSLTMLTCKRSAYNVYILIYSSFFICQHLLTSTNHAVQMSLRRLPLVLQILFCNFIMILTWWWWWVNTEGVNKLVKFILRGAWMCASNFTAIHAVAVEAFLPLTGKCQPHGGSREKATGVTKNQHKSSLWGKWSSAQKHQ